MPSSGSPRDYQRRPRRFFYRGVSMLPHDAQREGTVPFVQNVRSWAEGELTVRNGLRRVTAAALAGAVNTVARLNDPAGLAGGGPARRFLGDDTGVLSAAVPSATATAAYAQVDAGYSGDPLSCVPAMPVNSPAPWLYVGDSDRMRKFDGAGVRRTIGLPPPATPATASLAANQTTFLQSIDSGTWVAYGGLASAPSVTTRLSTTVNAIIYDTGAVGMASVSLADTAGLTEGATVDVGASPETVIVQEIIPAVSPTTIAAILYDAGANGLATIQPTGSFAMGQQEVASPDQIRGRYEDLDQPVRPRVTITRTVDFPVNGLVMVNGVELVRILSVAVGTDGVLSFRAFLAGSYAAGDTIVGAPAFRAFFNTTKTAADPVTSGAVENIITPIDINTPAYAGIQTALGPRDWSQTGSRAMQPDDIIALGFNASDLGHVDYVRLLLASNGPGVAAGDEFVENAYMYEWRKNDLSDAVQQTGGSSPTPTSTMAEAQAAAVQQGQVDTFYQDQFGQDPLIIGGADPRMPLVAPGGDDGAGGGGTSPTRTDGFVTVGAAPSRQLALGNNQWITLTCRVRDLARIGTDPGQTLSNLNAAAVTVQVSGTADPVTVRYADTYLTGGYGPDAGLTNSPYVYRYRYRSTLTGERGNPSPSMRAGVPARRQRVSLAVVGCTELQCDIIDVFRFGGSLARWAFVRTIANNTAGAVITADDDMADRQIDGGESLRTDLYQPWPVSDLPRKGTCNVAGTSVQWVSGDGFDTRWAPDSVIIVNGRATSLYGAPSSTTRLQVIDNCDSGTAVAWSIPSPTILAQPLRALWGGYIGDSNAWFHFACGDPVDPGAVHWSHGNDPDASSDANTLAVCSATEPLLNGCIWDGTAFVASTDDWYRLVPDFGSVSTFRAVKTACSRGLWNPWAFCVGDEGIYFVAKDGIFVTAGGSPEVSIVDPDLRPLFPRDGADASGGAHCVSPIDFNEPMRLTRVDQFIYFDYISTAGTGHTLAYEPLYRRWTPDVYVSGVRARLSEPGPSVQVHVVGCASGQAYQTDAALLTDDGTAISWLMSTPWENGDDPRGYKQFGDAVVDMNPGGSFDGLTVQPVVNNGLTGLAATAGLGASQMGRGTFIVEVGLTSAAFGAGVVSQNFGLLLSGVTQANDIARPTLFVWEPSWLDKGVGVARRATDWEDLGYKGAKFVQGVVIRANTFGVAKALSVQADGATVMSLSINHSGEVEFAYPLAAAGWDPFPAQLVRLLGADDLDWVLLDWRWVWEPAPELATQWETQETTFDFPGFGSIRDGVLAYQSTTETTLRVWHDAGFVDYPIPSSVGVYARTYHVFAARKGRNFKFRWTGDAPFRVFQRDCSVRAQPWGRSGGYAVTTPFGGPSRIAGAEL